MKRRETTKASPFEKLQIREPIDKFMLDDQIVSDHNGVIEVSRHVERTLALKIEADYSLKQIRAERDYKLRRRLTKAGEKPTDTAVRAMLETDEEVVAAERALMEAEEEFRQWQSLQRDYSERFSRMKLLGNLHASEYWHRDTVSGNANRPASHAKKKQEEAEEDDDK